MWTSWVLRGWERGIWCRHSSFMHWEFFFLGTCVRMILFSLIIKYFFLLTECVYIFWEWLCALLVFGIRLCLHAWYIFFKITHSPLKSQIVHHLESQTQMLSQSWSKNAAALFQRELHNEITAIQQIMFGRNWTVTGQILVLVGHCILPFALQKNVILS